MRAFDINITATEKDIVQFKRNSRSGEVRFSCQSPSGSESLIVFLQQSHMMSLLTNLSEIYVSHVGMREEE